MMSPCLALIILIGTVCTIGLIGILRSMWLIKTLRAEIKRGLKYGEYFLEACVMREKE